MLSEAGKERLKKLQAVYKVSLPAKDEELRQAWRQLETQNWSQAALDDLRVLIHRLAGSSASYGYAELGGAASAVERLLLEASPFSPVQKATLQFAFDSLLEILAEAST